MSSFLEQLENNEAVLLMYLAGELPEADRAEVEQMLQRDGSLRAALAELASLQSDLNTTMSFEGDVAASRREAAVRRVGRAVAAQQARPRIAADGIGGDARRKLRIAWWAYPVAAAAMLMLALLLLSGDPGTGTPVASHPTDAGTTKQYAGNIAVPDILPAASSDDSLAKIEHEALSLRTSDDSLFGSGSTDADR